MRIQTAADMPFIAIACDSVRGGNALQFRRDPRLRWPGKAVTKSLRFVPGSLGCRDVVRQQQKRAQLHQRGRHDHPAALLTQGRLCRRVSGQFRRNRERGVSMAVAGGEDAAVSWARAATGPVVVFMEPDGFRSARRGFGRATGEGNRTPRSNCNRRETVQASDGFAALAWPERGEPLI
jgi:hypothetical protein